MNASITVNWSMVMSIEHKVARIAFSYIMDTVDNNQLAHLDINGMVKSGIDRSALWRGLKELEEKQLIRRRGECWGEVWVNPEAVCPYWLIKSDHAEKVSAFYGGHIGGRPKQAKRVLKEAN